MIAKNGDQKWFPFFVSVKNEQTVAQIQFFQWTCDKFNAAHGKNGDKAFSKRFMPGAPPYRRNSIITLSVLCTIATYWYDKGLSENETLGGKTYSLAKGGKLILKK